MVNGYFSIVLHAHLPYVRHREAHRIEERWLFEAITETYIPLLWILADQKRLNALTISFSTPLMEMLSDPLMQRRFLLNIERTDQLLQKEESRVEIKEEELQLINFYKKRIFKIKQTFLEWDQNLLKGFKHYASEGKIVCICSSATHAFLPYLQTKEGIRAQILHGIQTFVRHFDHKPRGFWLPECAFTPGIDRILFEEGIRYTFVDEHALKYADPAPSKETGAPIFSPHGVMLFPRNSMLSNQVWSSFDGYPGDSDYREFYRDIAYDRDWDYIKPFMHAEGFRYDTGVKLYRITGSTDTKEFYNRINAMKKAKEHSIHFTKLIKKHLHNHEGQSFPPHIIVTPFDAELLGHWWFEGPDWLNYVLNEDCLNENLITPEEYLDRHYQDIETAHVSFNTWGRKGYGEVWLNQKNSWVYRYLHQIERDLVHYVTENKGKSIEVDRCLKQMVREWMLATSSDWSFIIDSDSATDYANNRIKEHITRYENLRTLLINEKVSHELLTKFEAEFPFIKEINLNVFISKHDEYVINKKQNKKNKKITVLMLVWEFPPMLVGGLSRHVYDISKVLVNQGCEIHVVTAAVEGHPDYEIMDEIHVHRVQCLQPKAEDFYHWVGSLNIAFYEHVLELSKGIRFDIIHAHDWLVCVAAKGLKHQLNLPLIATIHATEYGRNSGIYTQLQKDISHKEWELTYEAQKVIVCSKYMEEEVVKVFNLPKNKIEIIPNGVDIKMISGEGSKWKQKYGSENDIFIFSVGRIVKEKGFQTIIDAAPTIIAKHPNVKFIIAGKGPLLEEYKTKVINKGLQKVIYFIGFIDDHLRNDILNGCDICIFPSYYEPFGIVALEGMGAGKPTIVSDTGGLSEIVTHRENGLKIFPNNVQSLTTQVLSCIEDEKLAQKIAENGKKLVVRKYNWNSLAKRTVAIYETSLKQIE
ncbi:glycosyl transferase [Anaerobacillus alkalidiazotrophicus]|uniref:Glycosyl transferase n=1 Tax=Anaerobacillus alkalidiazotrophicus TaxID=472963 RepID=A0A1S2ME87_9BACI|nr:1,4-alpha-glucan branching protein domain-containing protein [Anaerobacillus alkalidiazotrophicus]OIJ22177.1 glycosyl transferase [Anaerobacillus alkalidiazotrophicus]